MDKKYIPKKESKKKPIPKKKLMAIFQPRKRGINKPLNDRQIKMIEEFKKGLDN